MRKFKHINARTGWPAKWGWWASTTDMNQLESVSVTRPPVPAGLPVKCSMCSKNAGVRWVTVNDIQFDRSTSPQNTRGRPKAGSFAAIRSHRAHAPSLCIIKSAKNYET